MTRFRCTIVSAMVLLSLLTASWPALAAVKAPDRPVREKPIIAGIDELIQQGLAHNAAGRYEEAWAVFREAATLDPENHFVLYNLGTVLGMLHRYREASLYLLAAVRISPDMLPAWVNLGGMYNQLAMPKEALEAFHQVLRLNPNDANARFQSGVNLVRLGRLAEAGIEEEELRAINPELADELLKQILAVENK